MFAHVTIRASDQAASERFYRTVLEPLEIDPGLRRMGLVAWEDFAIATADPTRPTTRHLHVAFVAPSHEHVDAFWRAGRDAGYRDDGAPGPRTQYREDYYGAFLLDPDGNSAEAVHHADARRGGHIDHLWIGVRDLKRSEAFYAILSLHLGLRPGRRLGPRRTVPRRMGDFLGPRRRAASHRGAPHGVSRTGSRHGR